MERLGLNASLRDGMLSLMRYGIVQIVLMTVLLTACAPRVNHEPVDPTSYSSVVRVACAGDSLTACPECWPSHLGALLGERWEVQNFGLGGGTVLTFGDHPYDTLKMPEVLAFQPDVVILFLGTNDSKPRHWYYKKEFERDYRQMILKLKALDSHPRIWICLPPPAFPGQWGIDDGRIREMLPVIRRVARREGIPVIDLYSPFTERSEWFPDQIHPNPIASAEMARYIYQALTGKNAPAQTNGAMASEP